MPSQRTDELPIADYLVIGAGAMAMAFTDTILTETDATVTIVDRRARPGGHWNDAYPFVRLHQPSAFYGVNSTELGSRTRDVGGWNDGLYELASGTEVVTYFDQIMHRRFLPSGRVRYLPMHDFRLDRGEAGPEGRARSLLTGEEVAVGGRRRVDATYMDVSVPSVRPPGYEVEPGATCVPLNDLPRISQPPDGYTVIGGGKTAMDACLWLLANGVDPETVRWIRPRDSWLLDRSHIQPGELAGESVAALTEQTEQIAAASSVDDLFERLEGCGALLRIDRGIRPTMYRCATVTRAELAQLRRITDVVRLGRVGRIGAVKIDLDDGHIPTSPDTIHVDCSADGLARLPPCPVFDGDLITLQSVRTCQQVFSAALIARVEALYDDEAERNELCTPVPHPDDEIDFLRSALVSTMNGIRWRRDRELSTWLDESRLSGFARPAEFSGPTPGLLGDVRRLRKATPASVETLQVLLDGLSVVT